MLCIFVHTFTHSVALLKQDIAKDIRQEHQFNNYKNNRPYYSVAFICLITLQSF